MSAGPRRKRPVLVAFAILAVLSLVYSILITRSVLAWLWVWTVLGFSVGLLYLAWRFVLAVERIADALESEG